MVAPEHTPDSRAPVAPGQAAADFDPAEVEAALSHLPTLGAFVVIKNVVEGGFSPFGWDCWHPAQRRFAVRRTGRDLILKSRQVGFSTIELLRDLQYARTHEGARVEIVVHDRDEKSKFFDRIRKMADALQERGLIPGPRFSTKTELVWADNGSAIFITEAGASEGAAQKTARSGTIDRLHASEAAFWGAPEETWASLEGSCEHGDEIVIESTANGADTWFHARWLAAVGGTFRGIHPHFFPWFEHPGREERPGIYAAPSTSRERSWERRLVDDLGITERQLSWWRGRVQSVGLDKTLREYPPTPEAAFQSNAGTWIDAEWLDELDAHVRAPLRLEKLRRGVLRVYATPSDGARYIVAADVSEGGGGDEAAMVVLDHRTGEVAAAWDDKNTSPKELARMMAEVGRMYGGALLAPEVEGMRTEGREPIGLVTLRELVDLGCSRQIYRHEDDAGDRVKSKARVAERPRMGWPTNKRTRPIMLEDMKDGIERQTIRSPDRRMVAEVRGLVRDRYGHIGARGKHTSHGSDDGLFFAWAIAHQVRQRARARRSGSRIEAVGSLTSSDFRT